MDEAWILDVVAERDYAWIATNFNLNDACIPLSLYAEFVNDTFGLNEFWLRAPAALGGTTLALVVAWLSIRYLRPAPALLLGGLVSVSPYLVYLSREARPHAITPTLLVSAAALSAHELHTENPSRVRLMVAASLAALSPWFHPITLGSSSVLMAVVCAAVLFRRPVEPVPRSVLPLILTTYVATLALTLAPSAASLAETIQRYGGRGSVELATVEGALMLPIYAEAPVPWWAVGLTMLPGAIWLVRRAAWIGVGAVVLVSSQVLAMLWLHSYFIQVPMIWLRYHVQVLPFGFLLLAGTLAWFDEALRGRWTKASSVVAASGVLAVFVHALVGWGYSIRETDAYNANPIMAYLDPEDPELRAIVPPFYSEVLPSLPAGVVVEAPVIFPFPVYGLYQRVHGRHVRMAGLGVGPWQSRFDTPGFRFHTVPGTASPRTLRDTRGVLIVHHRVGEEVARFYRAGLRAKSVARQLVPFPNLERAVGGWWPGRPALETAQPPIYQDDLMSVYELPLTR
ncbi:MAG: hypothetical protein IPL19_00735 [Sandaracinaceae bacterium]|nr:hypothetical protein [Sandaracinaceae bacterium]MBK8406484.1 hypothetical protein [Sandaracinaceae bacterium]MBK8593590.1 hypothetical protein [Sandaracinaceae bacterium]MBP7681887.1 hypothetical protein [Deltaproteobacteria bacterium]